MYYVRATGINRFTGNGTSRWLRIRSLKCLRKREYEIGVRINGMDRYVSVRTDKPNDLEFAIGWPELMPISLGRMMRGVQG